MLSKTVVLLACVAYAVANPAADTEWRWIPREATVSTNIRALPLQTIVESYRPTVFIPGTKVVSECGASNVPSVKIVGGSEATPHAYPWQVALFIDDSFFCGGSLISEDWVLTAAHCMANARSVKVVAGAHNLRTYEPTQVTMTSTNFFVHEEWISFLIRNDISLIKLPQAMPLSSAISPVCLPSRSSSNLPDGTIVTPTGWGKFSDSFPGTSSYLREVDVPVLNNAICGQYYGSAITPNNICIDSTGGRGTCNGDSGGPLNYNNGGKHEVRGIVSFGSAEGCEAGIPDAFTRVRSYVDWIETNTGIKIN